MKNRIFKIASDFLQFITHTHHLALACDGVSAGRTLHCPHKHSVSVANCILLNAVVCINVLWQVVRNKVITILHKYITVHFFALYIYQTHPRFSCMAGYLLRRESKQIIIPFHLFEECLGCGMWLSLDVLCISIFRLRMWTGFAGKVGHDLLYSVYRERWKSCNFHSWAVG